MMPSDVVQSFLATAGIRLASNRYLCGDLNDGESSVPDILEKTIKELRHLPNLSQKLIELARIRVGDERTKTSYFNALTEFLAIEFVTSNLNKSITAIESKGMPVLSPNRRGDRSCDFQTGAGEERLFWEVKDYSAEAQRMEAADRAAAKTQSLVSFDPSYPSDLHKWLVKMIRKQAIPKGANHLVVRMPTWGSHSRPAFSLAWANAHFPGAVELAAGIFEVTVDDAPLPEFFRSVFWIRQYGFVELVPTAQSRKPRFFA